MQPQGRSHSCTQRSTGIVASGESNLARGSKIRSASRVRCRVLASQRPRHEAYHAAGRGDQRALCTTQGSRHAFGCADDRRKEERQHHQEVLRTRESLVLFVQPRKNSKRASPHKNCLQADWSARACAAGRTERNWHEWSSLAASRGLQLGQKKQKKRELTRRKRFSTVTAALFRVLNTLSDPFHVQYVPHGQFESTM